MKNKLILTLILLTFSLILNAATLDQQRPDNISDRKWSSLKTAVIQNKLTPTPVGFGGGKQAYLGTSIAIDGNRALIGSVEGMPGDTKDDCIGAGPGFVTVLEYDGLTWQKKANLIPSVSASIGCYGFSVSLSNNRALIGDIAGINGSLSVGLAFLFEFDGAKWSEIHKFVASEPILHGDFGYSVAIDGDRVAIGSVGFDDTVNNSEDIGAVYIYDYMGGNWTETQSIVASNTHMKQYFGYSVSLEGNRMLIGSPEDNSNNTFGSAYVFELVNSNWIEKQILTATDSSNQDHFGRVVKLSGTRAIIGASASVYVFNENAGILSEVQKIIAIDGGGSDFGKSLDINTDILVVGAYKNNNKGSVYVYEYNGTEWIFNTKLIANDGSTNDDYGYVLGVSENSILVGAPRDDDRGEDSGSIYGYSISGSSIGTSQKYTTEISSYNDNFGSAFSVSNNRAIIGAPHDDDTGSVYVYDFDGNSWVQSAKLFASDAGADDLFGGEVSILGDVLIVAASKDDNSKGIDAGAVYVFNYDGNNWLESQKILTPSTNSSHLFGTTLVLTGSTLFIREDVGVYVYKKNGADWLYSELLTVPLGTNNQTLFGNTISVDGNRMLIGDVYDNEKGDYAGAAYIYEYDGVNWIQKNKILGSETGVFSLFGSSVSLKGNRAVILAAGQACLNGIGVLAGCMYIFEFDGINWNETFRVIPNGVFEISKFNDKLAINDNTIYLGSVGSGNILSKGQIIKFEFDGVNWQEVEIIKLNTLHYDEYFADSIQISNGKLWVSAHGDDSNSINSGVVYIFDVFKTIFANGFE